MLWIENDKYTPDYYAARLEALHKHTRRSTLCMVAICVIAATMQVLVNVTYLFCL